MSTLSIFEHEGTLVVSSETIAEHTGNEHRAVLQLVATHLGALESFGEVAFEMRDGYQGHGIRFALLNEQQATLLIAFMRNSPVVVTFKVALVKAFYEMARRLAAPALPQSYADALRELAATVEQNAALEAKVAEIEPRAEAWDEIASADGDYSVADAAKMLARAGVETGPQRLFEQLAAMRWTYRGSDGKWRPYASAVDDGYLAERPQSHHHPRTGEVVIDPPQVRVTLRGLERLRVRLGVLKAVS